MRVLKVVFAFLMTFGVAAGLRAADKDPKPGTGTEQPSQQTGSISGSLGLPSKEAPNGCVAEMKVAAAGATKGEDTIFYLFADGSVAKKLKDMAQKGQSATVTGVVTEKGYRVVSINSK